MLTKSKEAIKANNCLCKMSGVADGNLIKKVLYTDGKGSEYFDTYDIEQENLYEGDEYYIRLTGCGFADDNSIESILSKIADTPYTLKQISDIKQGIVSGADKYADAHQAKYGLNLPKGKGIFVLHKGEYDDLNLPDNEKKYVKKVYKNSQISPYHINYNDKLVVLYMTKNVSELDAPHIIEYLEQFKPILASKREAIEGKMPWYSLNWARDREIFETDEKIVNSRRAKANIFALETQKYYEQSDVMITVIKKAFIKKCPTRYALALLNSKLLYVWLKNKGKLKGDLLELYGKPLEEIPIKLTTIDNILKIGQLVEEEL